MHPTRIAELLEPFLAEAQGPRPTITGLKNISTYIDILLRWNSRVNLTAIRDEEEIVIRHFGESLFAARHLFPGPAYVGTAALGCPADRSWAPAEALSEEGERAAQDPRRHDDRGRAALLGRDKEQSDTGAIAPAAANDQQRTTVDPPSLADVGSGAGFPGIPLKLWAPQISLTLIESNHKKATFLREVARALRLTDINIQAVRAETLSAERKFDVVTLRAVEHFESILPIAANLLASKGRLALLISAAQVTQAHSTLPALSWSNPIRIPKSRSRVLLTGTSRCQPSQTPEPEE